MSLGIIVIRFVWTAHRLVSSNRPTRYASAASCKALIAEPQNLISIRSSRAISFTSLAEGAFLISKSVFFLCSSVVEDSTHPGVKRNIFVLLLKQFHSILIQYPKSSSMLFRQCFLAIILTSFVSSP